MLFLIQFLINSAHASALTQATLDYHQTSDQIELHEIKLDYLSQRPELFWPYSDEAKSFSYFGSSLVYDQGVNPHEPYFGGRAALSLGRKNSPESLGQASIGLDTLHHGGNNTTGSAFYFQSLFQWLPASSVNVSAELKHGFIYSDLVQPGSVDQKLQASSGVLRFANRMGDVRTQVQASAALLSDGNRRSSIDASVWFKVEEAVNWIWVGLGGEQLDYRFKNPNYWSPNSFWSIGPRFEVVIPFQKNWQISSGLNLNHFQESESNSGYGYYGTLRLQRGLREAANASLAYTHISSQQNDHLWFENSLQFSLNFPI